MALTLGTNISTLKGLRLLGQHSEKLASVYERLSSGQRINRASDDAAGLSVAESLRSDARILTQAVRNLNDGVSLLTVADAALDNMNAIVERLKELAEQSANGTYTTAQRTALDVEAQALKDEFTRITQTTTFNGINLLSTEGLAVTLQVGTGSSSNDTISADLTTAVSKNIGLGTYTDTILSYSGALGANQNGGIVIADFNGDGIDDIASASLVLSGGAALYTTIVFAMGSENGTYSISDTDVYSYASTYGGTLSLRAVDIDSDGDMDLEYSVSGSGGNHGTSTNLGNGTFFASTASAGSTFTATISPTVTGDFNNDGVDDTATITNYSNPFRTTISTQDTYYGQTEGIIEISSFSLATSGGALTALDKFSDVQDSISALRGSIGGSLSRINSALNVSHSTIAEYVAAESRIRDADIASETAELVRLQILQQAATAVLSQSNLQSDLVLKLISRRLANTALASKNYRHRATYPPKNEHKPPFDAPHDLSK